MSDSSDSEQQGGSKDDSTTVTPTAVSTSTQKVIGETSATDAAGVLGRTTASSTVTYGVVGETQSSSIGAAGVRGESTATNGATYGVHGTAKSNDFGAAAVFGESDTTHGLRGTTTALGHNGVYGKATATSGINFGVRGDVDSNEQLAAGVRGNANNSSGTGAGVWGSTDSIDDGAAGVRGVATGTAGQTYGVHAATHSDDTNAFAVFADASNSNADALRADSTGGTAGDAVHGITDTDGHWGIWGENQATSGTTAYGVYAETASNEAPALYAAGSGGGAVEADGHVDASQGYRGPVGSSAFLTTTFSNITSSRTTIPFDALVADQRGEFDTSNHWFECAYDGTYVVEFGLESFVDPTDTVGVYIEIDTGNASANPASAQGFNWDFEPNGAVSRTFTKTIYGLLAGNRIYIQIDDDSENLELSSNANETFFSVRQVGGGGSFTSSPQSTTSTTSAEDQ